MKTTEVKKKLKAAYMQERKEALKELHLSTFDEWLDFSLTFKKATP